MNVLVTGGTSGIGKSIVEVLSVNGHNVVFVGRDRKRGEQVASATGAHFVHADLSTASGCAQAADSFYSQHETCDVLINNAGLWTEGLLVNTEPEEIEKVLTINSLSPILLTHEMVKRIHKSKSEGKQTGARIIFINSQAGLIAKAERATYNASKWAITGFARSLALELAPENIAVTNLCPGYVATELFDHAGYPRETTGAIDPAQVADAVNYIVDLPESVSINELAIKPTLYS